MKIEKLQTSAYISSLEDILQKLACILTNVTLNKSS